MNIDKVWVGVVRHRNGHDLFAADTEARLYDKLADFCAQHWHEVAHAMTGSTGDEMEQPPENARELVDEYFERHGDDEWVDIEEVNL